MKPTRATLVSDPYRTAKSQDWRAVALINGQAELLIVGDYRKDLRQGDTVNARYEAGEWRMG